MKKIILFALLSCFALFSMSAREPLSSKDDYTKYSEYNYFAQYFDNPAVNRKKDAIVFDDEFSIENLVIKEGNYDHFILVTRPYQHATDVAFIYPFETTVYRYDAYGNLTVILKYEFKYVNIGSNVKSIDYKYAYDNYTLYYNRIYKPKVDVDFIQPVYSKKLTITSPDGKETIVMTNEERKVTNITWTEYLKNDLTYILLRYENEAGNLAYLYNVEDFKYYIKHGCRTEFRPQE